MGFFWLEMSPTPGNSPNLFGQFIEIKDTAVGIGDKGGWVKCGFIVIDVVYGMVREGVGVDVGLDRDDVATIHQILDSVSQVLACISFMPSTLMVLTVLTRIVTPWQGVRRCLRLQRLHHVGS